MQGTTRQTSAAHRAVFCPRPWRGAMRLLSQRLDRKSLRAVVVFVQLSGLTVDIDQPVDVRILAL